MDDPLAVKDKRLKAAEARLLLDRATASDMRLIRKHLADHSAGPSARSRRRGVRARSALAGVFGSARI